MNIHIIVVATLAALLCVSASASEPKIKRIDPAKVESLRVTLEADVRVAERRFPAWFDAVSICAPQLWKNIGGSFDKSGIEVIPVHFGDADGACFKGLLGNQRFAAAVAASLAGGIVRLPTPEEIRRYWVIFPFDEIEEPVFVISSERAEILVHLQFDQEKKRYSVFLLEALRLAEKREEPNQTAQPTRGKAPRG